MTDEQQKKLNKKIEKLNFLDKVEIFIGFVEIVIIIIAIMLVFDAFF